MKMNVTLEPHSPQFASRRTINRIIQHGPEFRALKSGNCPVLGDGLHWLVRSEDGWLGWLPQDEFNWAHVGSQGTRVLAHAEHMER